MVDPIFVIYLLSRLKVSLNIYSLYIWTYHQLMRKIVYHVATSLDHFIAHSDGSTDGILPEGDHVPDYLEHLKAYDTVIMGKNTYEFGYQFGLKPGLPAYANMMHYIFSKTLNLDPIHQQVKVIKEDYLGCIKQLKQESGTDIYLCGGGQFAGLLLDSELIDELKIKLNPVIFGEGIPLFGASKKKVDLQFQDSKVYQSGVLLITYKVVYS